jgi:hypothetical protein
MKKYIIALSIIIGGAIPSMALGAVGSHPVGTNVVDSQGTVYRIQASYPIGGGIEEKYRKPYTSAGAFTSYKYNSWANIKIANAADLNLPLLTDPTTGGIQNISPRPGALINDKGTVYIITSNARRGFTSEEVFKGLGYSYKYVYPGDTSFLPTEPPINTAAQAHPAGTLITDQDGTLYIMHFGSRIGVANMAALESWGYWLSDAVIANSYDYALNEAGVAHIRNLYEFDFFYTFQ